MKSAFLLYVLSALSICGEVLCSSNKTAATREKKFLSLFNVVRFQNGVCTGTGGVQGTCLTEQDCTARGGSGLGSCAAGFGVCCQIVVNTCGGTVTQNCSYIRNPEFPGLRTTVGGCMFSIQKCGPNICSIRLDFERSTFAPQAEDGLLKDPTKAQQAGVNPFITGDCITDQVIFTQGNGAFTPSICGESTGLHMYLDAGLEEDPLPITIMHMLGDSTFGRSWNYKVSQIPCGTSYTPRPGCLQWFTGCTGTITSYNYDGGHHLNEMLYSMCVRRELGFCTINYTPVDDFRITGKDNNDRALAGSAFCNRDGLLIPKGVSPGSFSKDATGVSTGFQCFAIAFNGLVNKQKDLLGMIGVNNVDRYCGNSLSCITNTAFPDGKQGTVTSTMGSPFIISFYGNNNEGADNGNIGFKILYRQLPC